VLRLEAVNGLAITLLLDTLKLRDFALGTVAVHNRPSSQLRSA
jgi:hypothetical protein